MLALLITLAYVGLLYIRPQEIVPALSGVPVLPIVLGLAVLAWIPWPGKRFTAPQNWLFPLLIAAMAASIAANGWAGGAVQTALTYLPLLALFYLLATTANSVGRHRTVITVLALCTLVLALHGIGQSQDPEGLGWSGAKVVEGHRITYAGIFNDPNDLALAFVIALPCVAYCMASARSWLVRAFWLGALGTMLYALYLTNSRGGMLAALAQGFVFAWWRYGTLKAGVLAAAGIAAFFTLPTRLASTDAVDESAAGRVESWYTGIQLLASHPVFGVGPGNFTSHHHLAAHNSWVQAFAELGLPGYFLWLSFVGISFWMVLRLASAAPPFPEGTEPEPLWTRHQAVARTYAFAMLGFCVAAFFLSRSYNVLLVLLCALCVAIDQCTRSRWPLAAPLSFRSLALPIAAFEVASIAGMYVLVKILL